MMHPHRLRRLFAAGCLILLVAVPCIWISRLQRQKELNHALIAAIKHKDADQVDSLLTQGANPNSRDIPTQQKPPFHRLMGLLQPPPADMFPTALMITYNSRESRIQTALITAHAEVNARDSGGATLLMLESFAGNTETVKMLIAAHADVNNKNTAGQSALMWAGMAGKEEIVKTLIAAKADVNMKTDGGFTAMKYANNRHRHGVVALLMAAGAKE